jgi:hypothetical protein
LTGLTSGWSKSSSFIDYLLVTTHQKPASFIDHLLQG